MFHAFNIDVASECGMAAAVILQHLHFWVGQNRAANRNEFNGRFWTYNTAAELQAAFPYLKMYSIRKGIKKLKDAGLIEMGNFNKLGIDRTIWYTVTQKAVDKLEKDNATCENTTILRKRKMQFLKTQNAICENEKWNSSFQKMQFAKTKNAICENEKPLPDNNIPDNNIPDNNTDIKTSVKSKKKIPAKDLPPDYNDDPNKKQYGKYVFLTDSEYQSLLKKCGGNSEAVEELIEMLDSYKGRNRRGYYSDVDALRGWCFKQYKQDHRFDKPATVDNFNRTMEILKRGDVNG